MTHDNNNLTLSSFTDVFADEIADSPPISLSPSVESQTEQKSNIERNYAAPNTRPQKHTGQYGDFRSVDEIDAKYRSIFTYPFFNLVQSNVIEDALYSDKSMVLCAPTGSGKTVVFEMAIVQLLMELEDKNYTDDFKIIYMAPVKAICTERLTEWYPKFTKLGLLCIEVTGDTNVDFSQLKPYRVIITTPEKWDILTRRWTDYRGLVGVIKLFLIDEVHILNDEARGPVLETVVSRMKTIESSSQSAYRIEQLQKQRRGERSDPSAPPRIRFVVVSATVSNPEDVAAWLSSSEKTAVYHKFGDECRPVKIKRIVEGYPCGEGTSIFKFDIILNYKLWPIIQRYYDGKPTLIFCNTRKSVVMTAETLARELTINFNAEQRAKLTALASTIKNKKLQALILNGVGCHHAGLLFEERVNIEQAFRQKDLPILITTTTLAMGVNLPAHLVIIKNTQQYVSGAYQEYSISTVLQMVGRAGRPQFDTEATAVIMTRLQDKQRYQALVGGSEPLQSYLHKRLPENLNSEAALRTVTDVAQCVQWLRSTFLYIRAAKDPRRYLGLPNAAAPHQISKKIEELCVKAMNGLATAGLITMDEASCIESTEAGRLMSVYYLDFETMKLIMKIEGTESLEQLLWTVCECHELADMHLRTDERRCLNTLNRSSAAAAIRFPMKGKITTRQMKLNCVIQAVLGCLPIPDPSLNQESLRIMRIADRVCRCLVTYTTRPELISSQPQHFAAVLNAIVLAKCIAAQLWENSPFVSKQLRGIGPTISNLLATAGKVNFMLLEEAHPRDLERIMNRNAPAGNVLRKQVSLLPKYKLTLSPVDERTVSIELSLLNQSHLADNMDALTAGDSHKSYIVVGDSENHILLLATFQDNNLITVFDGTITHTVTRKHRFEHKVFAHCISSTVVGIDVKAEYLFKDLDPKVTEINTMNAEPIEGTPTRAAAKQTNITDTFKERKRRNAEIDICQSKEKKKRTDALMHKLNTLKESFGRTTKELQDDLIKSKELSDTLLNVIGHKERPTTSSNSMRDVTAFEFDKDFESNFVDDNREATSMNQISVAHEESNTMDDSRIDSLLNDIENEILKTVQPPKTFGTYFEQKSESVQHPVCSKISAYKDKIKPRFVKSAKKADNFSFINLLEKNVDLSDDEVIIEQPNTTGFSEAVKCHIEDYLQKTRTATQQTPLALNNALLQSQTNNPEQDLISMHKNIDTQDNTVMQDQDNDLPECFVQNNHADFADKLKQISEELEESQTNQNTQNNIIELEDKILDQVDLADKLTQNILKSQEKPSTNNDTHDDINLKEESLHKAVEKSKQHEYDRPQNKDNSINVYDVIKIHDEIKKRYLNNKLKNGTDNRIDEVDPTRQKPMSVVRALFRNMSSGNDNLDIDTRDYECDAFSATDKSIIETAMALVPLSSDVPNHETEINGRGSEEPNSYQNGQVIVPFMNKHNAVTENCSKVSFNYRLPTAFVGVNTGNHNKDASNKVSTLIPIGYNDDKAEVSSSLVKLKPFDNERRANTSDSDKTLSQYPGIGSETHSYSSNIQELFFDKPVLEAATSSTNFPTITRKPIIERRLLRSRSPLMEDCFQQNGSYNTNSNKNSPNTKTNETHFQNMKKITYTATEIDVWTKQNKTSTLQVIKKMKVDLDITEIVSEENQRYRRCGEKYETRNHSDEWSCPLTPKDRQLNDASERNNQLISSNNVTTKINELISQSVPKTYKNSATQDSPCIEDIETAPNRVAIDENEIYTTEADVRTPVEDVGRSAVENILQKYANILRKKTESSQLMKSQHIPSSQTKSQKMKVKRPFKISDINKVETTLPESIIAVSTPATPPLLNTPPSNTRSFREQNLDDYDMQPNTKCHTPTKPSPLPLDEKINSPVEQQFECSHLDKTLDVIEEPVMSETCAEDFNIDHSMLDPKMLLQCYMNKQEEELPIIPPPPQFCDTQNSYFESGDCDYEPSCIDDSVLEKSNFEAEYERMVMTPPKEIETWTFDEENQENYEPAEPTNMYTISKNPIASYNGYNIKSIASRKARLREFKFNTKQKFNVRRK